MLHTYVCHESDREEFLPLVMFAYQTLVHATTGASPFDLMFGHSAHTPHLPACHAPAYDASSYPEQLHCKLSKLYDFVETHMIDATRHQQQYHTTAMYSEEILNWVILCCWISQLLVSLILSGKGGGWLKQTKAKQLT